MARRLMNVWLCLIFSGSLVAIPAAPGQGSAAAQQNVTSAANSMMMPMELVAPLFIEDAEFTSELIIVNASIEPTYADVLLRGRDGSMIAQRRVPLASSSQVRISIEEILRDAGSGTSTGSVIVMPSAELRGMAVAAQLTMTFRGGERPSYIDEELAMPSMEGSQDLHGVADPGDGSPLLSIANLSQSSQQITITCLSENASPIIRTLSITGTGATLVDACDQEAGGNLSVRLGKPDAKDSRHGTLGISLHTEGPPGSLAAFAINSHLRKDALEYTSIPFSDPRMLHSSGIVFSGVPSGAVPLLADTGEYRPGIFVANFGSKTVNIAVKFATSGTNSTAAVVNTIKTLALEGRRSVTLHFPKLPFLSPLQNSFIIMSDGAPGQVGAKLVSTNESAGLRAELLDKDEKHLENAGLHPWSLEQGSDSTLLLFNHYPQPNKFDVRIAAGAIIWQKTYTLNAFGTMALSLRQLQVERVKDDNGKMLPLDNNSGEINWANTAGPAATGRLLISNREADMARSFSCGSFEDLCSVSISPSSAQTINSGGSVSFNGSYGFCWQYNPGVCNGSPNGGGSAGLSWYASSPPLSGSGNCAGSTNCTITANDAGQGGVSLTASDSAGCTLTSSTTPVSVNPSISGPSDVWWFGGQNPSGYATSITLTSSGDNGTVWGVTSGSSEVSINATGNTLTVTSSGSSFSNAIGDVSIVATDAGQTSAPFYLTTHKPYLLSPSNTSYGCDPTYGYLDQLQYTVEDQMLIPLPTSVYYNEQWTTQVVPVISNNWQRPSETPGETGGSTLTDIISGPGDPNASPHPVCTGDATEVQYWGQDWHIGSTITGAGPRVQSDSLTRFVNHAEHQNIISPNP